LFKKAFFALALIFIAELCYAQSFQSNYRSIPKSNNLFSYYVPKPYKTYAAESDCIEAYKWACYCRDAVMCGHYTFGQTDYWFFGGCSNIRCAECYAEKYLCEFYNGGKCSCPYAATCKYNSAKQCYEFSHCDYSKCRPTREELETKAILKFVIKDYCSGGFSTCDPTKGYNSQNMDEAIRTCEFIAKNRATCDTGIRATTCVYEKCVPKQVEKALWGIVDCKVTAQGCYGTQCIYYFKPNCPPGTSPESNPLPFAGGNTMEDAKYRCEKMLPVKCVTTATKCQARCMCRDEHGNCLIYCAEPVCESSTSYSNPSRSTKLTNGIYSYITRYTK